MQAAVAQRVSLEFILPANEKVTVRVGKADAKVTVVDAEPLDARDERIDLTVRRPEFGGRDEPPTPLFRARFDASFTPGKNTIVASYRQPLGAREHDYGYVKDGRFLKQFQYELWPLKEWQLSPTFRLTVTLAMKRKAPGVLSSWFGNPPTVSCQGLSVKADGGYAITKFPSQPTQNGDRLELAFAMRDGFSDRLQCFLGDADLHP